MKEYSKIVNILMFDYAQLEPNQFDSYVTSLPLKLVRWLVAHHPDNRCRKKMLRMSNVECGFGTVVNIGFVVSDDYKGLLTIGERVAISPNVVVVCGSSPNNSKLMCVPGFKERYAKLEPVKVEDDAWIGVGSIILPGVRIGKGAIVGAGSIVNCDVSDGSIVAGNPIKEIRRLDL